MNGIGSMHHSSSFSRNNAYWWSDASTRTQCATSNWPLRINKSYIRAAVEVRSSKSCSHAGRCRQHSAPVVVVSTHCQYRMTPRALVYVLWDYGSCTVIFYYCTIYANMSTFTDCRKLFDQPKYKISIAIYPTTAINRPKSLRIRQRYKSKYHVICHIEHDVPILFMFELNWLCP